MCSVNADALNTKIYEERKKALVLHLYYCGKQFAPNRKGNGFVVKKRRNG